MEADKHREVLMMKRCLHLARNGGLMVKTNPLVGAVITFDGRIIGEGYHKYFGGPHAEIDALRNVNQKDRHLLSESHMYVSLEPCFHTGKTPPCVNEILKAKIPEVTICNIDPNPKTRGKSIAKLQKSGVKVHQGLLSDEGRIMNQKFFVNQLKQRPFIILKWAQSKDRYIGHEAKQVWLSNEQSRFMVHRWRTQVDAIMVGTNTVIIDNPSLTNRMAEGPSPVRIILDKNGRIPKEANVLNDKGEIHLFTTLKDYRDLSESKCIHLMEDKNWYLQNILNKLYELGVSSVLIEGGAKLLKYCIKSDLWDEARVIQTNKTLTEGIKAPMIKGKIRRNYKLADDKIVIINKL